MSLMNMFAIEATAANTTNNPVPTAIETATAMPTATDTSLDAIMASIVIEFDSVDECESIVVEKDGVEYRFSRTQHQVEVTPERNYGWARFSAKCTIVHFVKGGIFIGQTAILSEVRCTREAYNLVKWGVVEVCNDRVKFL